MLVCLCNKLFSKTMHTVTRRKNSKPSLKGTQMSHIAYYEQAIHIESDQTIWHPECGRDNQNRNFINTVISFKNRDLRYSDYSLAHVCMFVYRICIL